MPPSVASSGSSFLPVAWEIDLDIILLNWPGLFKNDRALISWRTLQVAFILLVKTVSILSSIHSIRVSAVCRSLKRIFIVAFANSGITLWAVLPTSKVGICILVGKKNSLPSSIGFSKIFDKSLVR